MKHYHISDEGEKEICKSHKRRSQRLINKRRKHSFIRFDDEQLLSNMKTTNHREIAEEVDDTPIKYKHIHIDKTLYRVKTWNYKDGNEDDLHTTLDILKEKVEENLVSFIKEKISIPFVKFGLTVVVEFAKLLDVKERKWTTEKVYFTSKNQTLSSKFVYTNFNEAYNQSVRHIWENCDKFIQNGSGWVFWRIHQVKLSLFRYRPLAGSSFIPTPSFIRNKRCVINIKNTDNQCFKWSILAHKFGDKVNGNSKFKSNIYNRKAWVNSIDWSGIQFPTTLSDVDTFETNNPDWAVTVLQINTSSQVIPAMIRNSRFYYSRKIAVVLLLIVDEESGNQHFTLVTDVNRLCKTNLSNKSKVCLNCMKTFKMRSTIIGKQKDELKFQEHLKACTKDILTKFTFPKNKKMKFRNIGYIKRNEFNITADFECLMGKPPPRGEVEGEEDENSNNNETIIEEGMNILSTHKVFAVGMHVVSDRFQDQFKPQKYREGVDGEENAGYAFCRLLHENMEKINYLYETECNKPMTPLTLEEEKHFQEGKICHICEEEITCKFSYQKWLSLMQNNIFSDDPTEKDKVFVDTLTMKGPKVRDHNHWDSKFRGIAHSSCNLLFRERGKTMKTNVFLHNGGSYDFHLILQNLFKFMEDNENIFYNPKVIAKTLENFMQITINSTTVIKDSLNFLGTSLDKLVKNLKDEAINGGGNMKELFKHTYSYFEELRIKNPMLKEDDFHLLTSKGVYPYQYLTSLEKCLETSLPPINEFYSDLTGESISETDYAHGKKVFETFRCSNLGDYTDIYVLTDTLLLSDCLESFRKTTYKYFKLDPVYYTSTPSLSLDCALKFTKSEFEILDTIEKANFIDESIIGGYSAAHECYVGSNNKFIPQDYNPNSRPNYNFYFDVNNLYGSKLRGLLPYGGFKFVGEKALKKFNDEEFIKNIPTNSAEGYFIKCDVDYPKELHNQLAHITLPLIPYHLEIKPEMLSDYQRTSSENLSNKIGGKKVVTSLFDKTNLILHYVQLKQALNLGLKLKKVHAVLKCKQGYPLRTYIDFCTEMRKRSKNAFEKDFWKLCINALFGKFCENLKLRRLVKILSTTVDFMNYVRKPTFERGTVYDEARFVGVEMRKDNICLDKPRYVGSAVLSLSKTVLYDFHYNFIFKHFPSTLLSFTDTDSLFYNITTDSDIYEILQNSNLIDFSNYPKSSKYYNSDLFLTPGKWKDELGGFPVKECIALRSKMYSLLFASKNGETQNKKVAKGITRNFQKKFINHNQYVQSLETNEVKKCQQTNIRSRDHQLYTTQFVKNGLSAWNDKRLIYRDMESKEFFCIPLGHYLSTSNLSDEEIIKTLKQIVPPKNSNKRKIISDKSERSKHAKLI